MRDPHSWSRRRFLGTSLFGAAGLAVAACADDEWHDVGSSPGEAPNGGRFFMPAEETPHTATWMCFPSSNEVWGADLPAVQETIAAMALAIRRFEPVRMLARPDARRRVGDLVGSDIEVIDAPVDDLWARDTLPLFLTPSKAATSGASAVGRVRFNGWGDKQIHRGDEQLAHLVADIVGLPLLDSGLVGEGGGLEVDGAGTVLAARSSWVNKNRNPGRTEAQISAALVDLLGAQRMVWVDGIAGKDIADGHIDTLARFADPATIVHEFPALLEAGETWSDVAKATATTLARARDAQDRPYRLVRLTQPTVTRGKSESFLSSYVNYYVCNGAVIAPQFGDMNADTAAADALAGLYPGRTIVQLNIDPVAEGGGGIHCATQHQPG